MKKPYLFQSIALAAALVVGLLMILNQPEAIAAPLVTPEEHGGVVLEPLAAQDVFSTAYVVVRFGNYDTIVRPVTFTEPISAYRALELSGLAFTLLILALTLTGMGLERTWHPRLERR